MRTIILPGYSKHNKVWAYEIQKKLALDQVIWVHEWMHWGEAPSLSVPREIAAILEELAGDSFNIIAKSVGTRVAMELIPQVVNRVNKVILCGIPTKFESQDAKDLYQKGLTKLSPNDIICIQNTADPFASFHEVSVALAEINPDIEIIEKERKDHEYPYFEDFQKFLYPS